MLRPEQAKAVDALLAHEIGVLCAPTAFGKTVAAAAVVAARKTNTLIIVHRTQLLDQWCNRLSAFLQIDDRSIGTIGAGKRSPTGIIDIAIMQSLVRRGVVRDIVANYGQVIVDECHHVSAFSFERVMKEVKAPVCTWAHRDASASRWSPPHYLHAVRTDSLSRLEC